MTRAPGTSDAMWTLPDTSTARRYVYGVSRKSIILNSSVLSVKVHFSVAEVFKSRIDGGSVCSDAVVHSMCGNAQQGTYSVSNIEVLGY